MVPTYSQPLNKATRSYSKAFLLCRAAGTLLACSALGFSTGIAGAAVAIPAMPRVALAVSHIPELTYRSTSAGATDLSAPVELEFALKPRNAEQIPVLLQKLKDPGDPMYGRYLTPEQYRAQFGRTHAEISQVLAYAQRHNFKIVEVKPNNLFVRVQASVADVNAAFGITLRNYVSPNPADLGHVYHAPDRQPSIDSDVAPLINGIMGLNNAGVLRTSLSMKPIGAPRPVNTYGHPRSNRPLPVTNSIVASPNIQYYTGNDGLSPYDTANIYNFIDNEIGSTAVDASGQTLGLVEFGTFTPDDIGEWESYYGYPNVPLDIISVDGYNTNSTPGNDAGEYTLDVDMMITFAYGMSALQCYENTDQGASSIAAVVQQSTDEFIAMANASTRPSVISDSYSVAEDQLSASDVLSEGEALDQLALQGQTVCVASGDSAAHYDEKNSSLNVADPSSQPTIVCVGGTDLQDNEEYDSDGNEYVTYASESSWFDSKDTQRGKYGTGGSGGISTFWSLPNYQYESFNTSTNTQGSTSMRNLPDVSLFGDFDDGYYDIYFTDVANGQDGQWTGSNGTSAASPLWAALLGCVNQFRSINKLPALGEANPDIYAIAESSSYSKDFHDIDDNSTNGYFKAVKGYDNSTGWGSPNNAIHLIEDLSEAPTYIPWTLTTSATAITSGKTAIGTITLPLPASEDDKFHITTSNSKTFTVPTSVTVSKGSSSASFTITSVPQNSATPATLGVNFFGYARSVTLTVNPASLTALSVSPTSVTGGSKSTGTVTLHGTAGPKGVTVNLKSSNTSDATVPSSVTVSSGNTSATFAITTKTVSKTASVTITASTSTTSKTATLSVKS